MSNKRKSCIRIPDDPPGGPSMLPIIILFVIPEFITKVIGGYLLYKRIRNESIRRRYHLYRRYAGAIGTDSTVSIRALAAMLDRPTANVVSELQSMIDEGIITGNAYIDRSHLTLYLDHEQSDAADFVSSVVNVFVTPEDRAQTVADAKARRSSRSVTVETEFVEAAPREKTQSESGNRRQAEPRRSSSDSENFEAKLREIRQLNDEISDPAVSERIDRIGELTAGIFRLVREKPEHAEEVRKFMNYYLPTTLKLLKSYSLMEKQSYQGENIQASRKKIEDVLDTLVRAFEQLQDRLFRTEAMDVETDISVLETMMASDGLLQQNNLRAGGSGGK